MTSNENEGEISEFGKLAHEITKDILKTVCQPDVITLVLPRGFTFKDNLINIMDAEDFLEMIAPVVVVET